MRARRIGSHCGHEGETAKGSAKQERVKPTARAHSPSPKSATKNPQPVPAKFCAKDLGFLAVWPMF